VDESKMLDGWSYLLASLFGPIYVLAHGFVRLSLLMLLISIVIGAIAAGFLVYVLVYFDSASIRTSAIVAVPIAALMAQGLAEVEVVFAGYVRRGWREGY
jgi:hypothetical protein